MDMHRGFSMGDLKSASFAADGNRAQATRIETANRCRNLHRNFLSFIFATLLAAPWMIIFGQTPVDNTTATPAPGDQHYYITQLSEIVSPMNGSLSIRVQAPTPHARGINLPVYAKIYDTNGQFYPTPSWGYSTARGAQLLTAVSWEAPYWLTGGPNVVDTRQTTINGPVGTTNGTQVTCTYLDNFTYTDATGGRHPFNFLTTQDPNVDSCRAFNISPTSTGSWSSDGSYTGYLLGYSETIVFNSHGDQVVATQSHAVEDSNGNYLGGPGYTKTSNSLSIPGLGGAYSWTTHSAGTANGTSLSFNAAAGNTSQDSSCPTSFPTRPGMGYGDDTLTLPNNGQYTFGYDPTFNNISQITYPTGVVVTYTWQMIPQSQYIAFFLPSGSDSCYYRYDWPAITKRVVSVAGTNVEEQDFSYTTTWGSSSGAWTQKTTTVTTKDLLRPGIPSTSVVYTYMPTFGISAPLESKIEYHGTDGAILKTVQRVWNSDHTLEAECTTESTGSTSGVFYKYESPYLMSRVTDKGEFDFGLNTSYCQQPAIGTNPVWPSSTPTRETQTIYASFSGNSINPYAYMILDRPQSVKFYGNGTLVSETDYGYDESTIHDLSNAPDHHDSNFGTSYKSGRGNLTSVTRKCITGTGCTQDSVTKYEYDITGQLYSMTDPNLNTTLYSFSDNYVSGDGSPSANSNAYLTSVTYPTVNGITQSKSFSYGYNDGHMRSETDVDNKTITYYCYTTGGCNQPTADPWARLTEIDYPDGGQTKVSYSDSGNQPSWTESVKLDSSGTSVSTTTVLDGMGRPTQTQLNGTIYRDTTYDGIGQVWKQSNPYFVNASSSTDGTTLFTYDGLGRTVKQVAQDGTSTRWWCYNGIASASQTNCNAHVTGAPTGVWVDSADENGNDRQQTSNALGQMTFVAEPNGTASTPSMGTTYGYDVLGNLWSVTQNGLNGSAARLRTFSYDSLSRLTSATNPESGTITYAYDANGNVFTKTSPAPNQTAGSQVIGYCYDALNRITSRLNTTPSTTICASPANAQLLASYSYDTSVASGTSSQYVIGRLTDEKSYLAEKVVSERQPYSYDAMGRLLNEFQYTPANLGTNAPYAPAYRYDLAGNLVASTDGATPIQSVNTQWPCSLPSAYAQTVNSWTTLALVNCYDSYGRTSSVTSNWGAFPVNLFSETTYLPPGQLQKWGQGPNVSNAPALTITQGYSNRLWQTSITASGQIPQ